jgi:hypothetical protein
MRQHRTLPYQRRTSRVFNAREPSKFAKSLPQAFLAARDFMVFDRGAKRWGLTRPSALRGSTDGVINPSCTFSLAAFPRSHERATAALQHADFKSGDKERHHVVKVEHINFYVLTSGFLEMLFGHRVSSSLSGSGGCGEVRTA